MNAITPLEDQLVDIIKQVRHIADQRGVSLAPLWSTMILEAAEMVASDYDLPDCGACHARTMEGLVQDVVAPDGTL